NVKFPTKVYGNFIYPAGEYEAVLITIGKGEGANWWCVLFPPMCFLDFSSGTAVRKEEHVVKAESPEEDQVEQAEGDIVDSPKIEEDKVKEKKVVKQEVAKKVTASEKKVVKSEIKVEEQPVSKEETKTVEKVENPVEKKQEKQNEYVHVEEEEKKPEVKLFIVEAFTSLFSK
ncbi:stage II sporulation protein R, partial [Bacillus toyonensis]